MRGAGGPAIDPVGSQHSRHSWRILLYIGPVLMRMARQKRQLGRERRSIDGGDKGRTAHHPSGGEAQDETMTYNRGGERKEASKLCATYSTLLFLRMAAARLIL